MLQKIHKKCSELTQPWIVIVIRGDCWIYCERSFKQLFSQKGSVYFWGNIKYYTSTLANCSGCCLPSSDCYHWPGKEECLQNSGGKFGTENNEASRFPSVLCQWQHWADGSWNGCSHGVRLSPPEWIANRLDEFIPQSRLKITNQHWWRAWVSHGRMVQTPARWNSSLGICKTGRTEAQDRSPSCHRSSFGQ